MTFFVTIAGREISRRISRKCRGLAVPASAQSARRGPLVPVPHERRSKTASFTASSARITAPEARVMGKSHGTMPTYARPAFSHAQDS